MKNLIIKKIKTYLKTSWLSNIILFVLISLVISGIYKCPFKLLTNYDCPGCGFTRAFIALCQMDFETAFNYYPLFPLIIFDFSYIIFSQIIKEFKTKNLRIKKFVDKIILITSLTLLLVVWIIKQF